MFHRRLLREFKENKSKVTGMVLTQWIMLIANVFLMIYTACFIELIVNSGQDKISVREKAIGLIIVLAIVLIIRSCMSYANSRLSFVASKCVKTRLREMIYDKVIELGEKYKENFQTAEVVQLATEGVEQLEIYFGKYVPQFFYSMIAPLTLFIVVGTMSIKVAVVLLICVPLIPVSIVLVQKFAKKMLAKYWGTYTEMGDSFLECIQGLTTLKIYQADGHYAKKMDEEAEKFRKVTMKVLIMQLNSISIMDLVAYGGAAIGAVLSIIEYQNGNISLAQCFFIIMISSEFFLPLRLLGSFFHIAMNGNGAADKIFRLIDIDADKDNLLSNESEKQDNIKTVEFNEVSFSYEENIPVLKDITFKAEKGITALVGESGCGKSTIAALIMKELNQQNGTIKIGERASTEISRDTILKSITRIRHDNYLFAGSVRENLLMGKADASENEMKRALKQVHLYDYIMENGGLDYELKENASNLSGGQKQRLAIARAILHDTQMYIFDEATSNIDVESEDAIMKVVRALAKEKTVILISHRLANVTDAKDIYVLNEGNIVEHGKHEQLISGNGVYKNLYMKQHELENFGKETSDIGKK